MAATSGLQRLKDKVAIVTGASSGLGRAISIAYAREGAKVVCADLGPKARGEVESEQSVNTDESIRQADGSAIFVKADVTNVNDIKGLVAKAVEQYGRIDILVNNAGIAAEAGQVPQKVHETSDERWDKTIAVNLTSIFRVSKHVIPQMLKQEASPSGDRGWIINISSIYGLVGGLRIPSYAAAKGGVSNLTRQIALDYAENGIHCNAICPGYTDTAIFSNTIKYASKDDLAAAHPLHGIGKPQDIVGAAIFLASADARWVTGACLPVDGGYTAR